MEEMSLPTQEEMSVQQRSRLRDEETGDPEPFLIQNMLEGEWKGDIFTAEGLIVLGMSVFIRICDL